MDWGYLLITLYSIAGSTASLYPYFISIKRKLNKLAVHEQILFNCYKKAVKDVTGKDSDHLSLMNVTEILDRAINYLDNNNLSINELQQSFSIMGENIDFIRIQERFIELLRDSNSLELITSILIDSVFIQKETAQRLKNLEENVTTIKEKVDNIPHDILKLIPQNNFHEEYIYDNTFVFQEAPKIQEGFIERNERLENLNNQLFGKNILFVSGLTRSGKSILISQYLQKYFKSNYYWYDFKLNNTVGVVNFYNDLVNFLSIKNNDGWILKKWKFGQISISEIIKEIEKLGNNYPDFVFVLDNIHLITEFKQIEEFVKSVLEVSQCKNKFILISEHRDSIEKMLSININCSRYELRGFDKKEIIDLFKANNIESNNISDQLLSLVQISTEGHPDIINGLISTILNNSSKNSTITEIIKNILDGWKGITETTQIIQKLADSLNHDILNNEDELKLFVRLSVLISSFSEELALFVSTIAPEINSFGLRFRKIRNNLLDIEPSNKYRVPNIYRKVGEQYISIAERKTIYKLIAVFLMTPKSGIVKFEDGIDACYYSLMASDYERAFYIGTSLVVKTMIKGEQAKIEIVLEQLEFLLNIGVDEKDYDSYLKLSILYLNGYRQLKNTIKPKDIIIKIEPILQHASINTSLKYLANNYLISYFSHEKPDVESTLR